ncbi:EpsG family protein [Saccharospirillum mangrovi]|uniref:EpsG family protein n=1 Tax=Saccharospirillum mangrovi TaxID=2161747 RepID=UPI000D3BC4B2|nr:EpsG family protein [Saccharospirillum mangrovi]
MSSTIKLVRLPSLYLYVMVFLCLCFFVAINPEVGRDYFNYVRIIGEIGSGEYFREPGFSSIVLFLLKLGLSPEAIVLFFRIITMGLLLRFFYSVNSPLLGLYFFLFVPNIAIGLLNALQTWLAIGIFLQAFVNDLFSQKLSYRRLLAAAVIATSFHISALFYLLVVFYYIALRILGVRIMLAVFAVGLVFTTIAGGVVVEYIGYGKYSSSNLDVLAYPNFLAIVLVLVVLFNLMFFSGIQRDWFLSLIMVSVTVFWLFNIVYISQEIYLRFVNFLLPFILVSLINFINRFGLEFRVQFKFMFGLLILINFLGTVLDIEEDMLNFDQIERLFMRMDN